MTPTTIDIAKETMDTIGMTYSTTIKIASDTRDRLHAYAQKKQLTLNKAIEQLLDSNETAQQLAQLQHEIAATSKDLMESYLQETQEWLDADLS